MTSYKIKSYFNNHAHHHAYHYDSRHNDPSIYISIKNDIQRRDADGRIKILDVGCGDGPFIKNALTARIDADFIGFDISINMIKMAKNSLDCSGVQLLAADGSNMPLRPEAKFDLDRKSTRLNSSHSQIS